MGLQGKLEVLETIVVHFVHQGMKILPLTYQPENTHKAAHAAGGIAGIYTHAHTTQGGVQGHMEGIQATAY